MPVLPSSIATSYFRGDQIPNQAEADADRSWQLLLADFNRVPLGEPVSHPIVSTFVHATESPPGLDDINYRQPKHERIRLAALNAWAVVLSYHTGSSDIVVAEGV